MYNLIDGEYILNVDDRLPRNDRTLGQPISRSASVFCLADTITIVLVRKHPAHTPSMTARSGSSPVAFVRVYNQNSSIQKRDCPHLAVTTGAGITRQKEYSQFLVVLAEQIPTGMANQVFCSPCLILTMRHPLSMSKRVHRYLMLRLLTRKLHYSSCWESRQEQIPFFLMTTNRRSQCPRICDFLQMFPYTQLSLIMWLSLSNQVCHSWLAVLAQSQSLVSINLAKMKKAVGMLYDFLSRDRQNRCTDWPACTLMMFSALVRLTPVGMILIFISQSILKENSKKARVSSMSMSLVLVQRPSLYILQSSSAWTSLRTVFFRNSSTSTSESSSLFFARTDRAIRLSVMSVQLSSSCLSEGSSIFLGFSRGFSLISSSYTASWPKSSSISLIRCDLNPWPLSELLLLNSNTIEGFSVPDWLGSSSPELVFSRPGDLTVLREQAAESKPVEGLVGVSDFPLFVELRSSTFCIVIFTER